MDRWYVISLIALGVFLAGLGIGVLWSPRRRKQALSVPAPPTPRAPWRPERTTCDWDAELAHLLEEQDG